MWHARVSVFFLAGGFGGKAEGANKKKPAQALLQPSLKRLWVSRADIRRPPKSIGLRRKFIVLSKDGGRFAEMSGNGGSLI